MGSTSSGPPWGITLEPAKVSDVSDEIFAPVAEPPTEERGGRTPPQDLYAEQAVLGSMMLSRDAIADVIEVMRGDDFYKPAHQVIFEAIAEIYAAGDPVDALTVGGKLTEQGELGRVGGPTYLFDLISSVPTAASAGYYAEIVAERAVLRRLIDAGTRIVQLGYATEGGEVEALVNAAQAEVFAVTERGRGEDYAAIGEVLDGVLNEIEAAEKRTGEITGIPTGLRELDSLTQGLQAGQMVVIAARPAMGKSTLGIDICRSAAIRHGMAAAVFSLEMSKSELVMRILAAEASVNLGQFRNGGMTDRDWTKIARALSKVSDAPLFLDDSPNLTLIEIRAKARRLKQMHDLKLIVIDYLQLMTSGKRVESRQQEVSEFSRSLKLLAKELEVPVIAISQLNRGSEQRTDKRPMVSDLRESGSIEQDADIVMLVHRPEVYDKENRPGEADIIVAKHRNGPTADIAVAFQGAKARFADLG
ncbi:replicative DNA helicase [Micrococcales bacterium 31B]|nr:replicative DNA helicase [Micrococcales bacterium 31B]